MDLLEDDDDDDDDDYDDDGDDEYHTSPHLPQHRLLYIHKLRRHPHQCALADVSHTTPGCRVNLGPVSNQGGKGYAGVVNGRLHYAVSGTTEFGNQRQGIPANNSDEYRILLCILGEVAVTCCRVSL